MASPATHEIDLGGRTAGDSRVEHNRLAMVALLKELATAEGFNPTAVSGVRLGRVSHRLPRAPVLYEPCVYIVASGRKRGFVGDRQFVYDSNNYLVLSVPLPFECETDPGDDEPMLGLSVAMELGIVSELAARMELRPTQPSAEALACVHATPIDAALGDAAVRLLECLRSPVEAAVLGPAIKREITYRVLCGPRAEVLFAMLGRNGHGAQIHAVLRQMDLRYAEPLSVAGLAAEVGMSVSALHHHFKAATSSSPLQYLKALRLHKARALILHEGVGAATAAVRVGYESASQFSREFKRFFGSSPIADARRVRVAAVESHDARPSAGA